MPRSLAERVAKRNLIQAGRFLVHVRKHACNTSVHTSISSVSTESCDQTAAALHRTLGHSCPTEAAASRSTTSISRPDLGTNPVASMARYPVMTAAQAHSASLQEGRTNLVSLGSLCRCAIEAAAKTVWLLAPTVRRVLVGQVDRREPPGARRRRTAARDGTRR